MRRKCEARHPQRSGGAPGLYRGAPTGGRRKTEERRRRRRQRTEKREGVQKGGEAERQEKRHYENFVGTARPAKISLRRLQPQENAMKDFKDSPAHQNITFPLVK